MTIAVHRLDAGSRAALAAHFLALSAEDRRLRFGSSLASGRVCAYVDGIDFRHDVVFAVRGDCCAVVGVAHVALGDDDAELGLSVLPGHRGRGVGSALFERAASHARNHGTSRLFMHCLTENAPIMRIARRFGMNIVTNTGDADAYLELPPASAASRARELATGRFAQCERALKARAAAWKRLKAKLRVAGRGAAAGTASGSCGAI